MAPAERPRLLLMSPALAGLAARLEDVQIERVWDHPEPLAFARATPGIRALALIGMERVSAELIDALPDLELIACLASGYEGVDLDAARARGIAVSHSASVNSDDVADHTVGLLLASARHIVAGDRLVREGRWGAERLPPARAIAERRVGIVGLGVLGKAIAGRLAGFGPEIAWWGRHPQPEATLARKDTLLDLAAWADILIVTARASADNRNLIDAAVLDALGPEGLLINIARGSIVDEDALIAALRGGRLGAAALDVFAAEPTPAARWADVPNLVLTPHIAGTTTRAGPMMMDLLAENLRRHFAGEPLATPVG